MGVGLLSNWAYRNILDNYQRFTATKAAVYLRIQEDEDSEEEYTKYGFIVNGNGYVDIEVKPNADVEPMSYHNIGLNQTRLNFGAHKFKISHSFVKARMIQIDTDDPYEVFRAKDVFGLYYTNKLFSMESIVPNIVGNDYLFWEIVGNTLENEVT